MKALFLDCFSGISGDMFLSALIDAGLDADFLIKQLKLLDLDGYTFTTSLIHKNSIRGTQINIQVTTEQHHRHLNDINSIIIKSSLSENIKNKALKIFKIVAEAEAKVHGVPINKIHFHEVGAVDSIVDIVGAAIAVETLKLDTIYCAPLPLGRGFIECEHGTLPIPAPATAEILKGIPIYMGPVEGELVTPTGAAIVKTLVDHFEYPEIKAENIGYGFGSKEYGRFNALRAIIGEIRAKPGVIPEEINILECNLDDINPELIPYIQNALLKAGALDVYIQNTIMKKGRPGFELKIICHPAITSKLVDIVFKETTTLGIRFRKESRFVIKREIINISTPYGNIGVKAGFSEDNKYIQYAPEFKDCKAAAEKSNIPLKEIYNHTIAEIQKLKINKT